MARVLGLFSLMILFSSFWLSFLSLSFQESRQLELQEAELADEIEKAGDEDDEY